MAPSRHQVPPIEGASQRLHEDTQRFSKGLDLFLGIVLDALCTLVVFTPILFDLGAQAPPPRAPARAPTSRHGHAARGGPPASAPLAGA